MIPTEISWTPLIVLAGIGGLFTLLIAILIKLSEPKDSGNSPKDDQW